MSRQRLQEIFYKLFSIWIWMRFHFLYIWWIGLIKICCGPLKLTIIPIKGQQYNNMSWTLVYILMYNNLVNDCITSRLYLYSIPFVQPLYTFYICLILHECIGWSIIPHDVKILWPFPDNCLHSESPISISDGAE